MPRQANDLLIVVGKRIANLPDQVLSRVYSAFISILLDRAS